jgi:hypothetical protein
MEGSHGTELSAIQYTNTSLSKSVQNRWIEYTGWEWKGCAIKERSELKEMETQNGWFD